MLETMRLVIHPAFGFKEDVIWQVFSANGIIQADPGIHERPAVGHPSTGGKEYHSNRSVLRSSTISMTESSGMLALFSRKLAAWAVVTA